MTAFSASNLKRPIRGGATFHQKVTLLGECAPSLLVPWFVFRRVIRQSLRFHSIGDNNPFVGPFTGSLKKCIAIPLGSLLQVRVASRIYRPVRCTVNVSINRRCLLRE
jgi:hypothetical protein